MEYRGYRIDDDKLHSGYYSVPIEEEGADYVFTTVPEARKFIDELLI
jgi:hypothetical protein